MTLKQCSEWAICHIAPRGAQMMADQHTIAFVRTCHISNNIRTIDFQSIPLTLT